MTSLALGKGGSRGKSGHAAHFATDLSQGFRDWVLMKEREGCVFWCKPATDFNLLSAFFEDKLDLVKEQPYRPLILDPLWWRTRFHRVRARFCGNPSQVVTAFNVALHPGLDPRDQVLDLPALQELIYQSNPALEPVLKWPHAPSMRFLPRGLKATAGYVGQTEHFRGFIDHEGTGAYKRGSLSRNRVRAWPPTKPLDRLDNLYGTWAVEDEIRNQRRMLATHGAKWLEGSMTAR
mmetsp:Transcript_13353/g.35284  ORF Transcript_13353/g.35284 Transcript_13353/m.35284 type:complete len:235 (+) Transcript_13353:196-900(+)